MKTHSPIINCMLIFSLLFFLHYNARAFDYIISFTGSGAATTIDSIRVMNLTAGTSELLPADYNLHLYNTSTNVSFSNENTPQLYFYREAGAENSVLSYNATENGNFGFNIFSVDGKTIIQKKFQLDKGRHLFQVQLPQGVYTAQVDGLNNSSSVRIISTSTIIKKAGISYSGVSDIQQPQKIGAPEKTMLYTPDDRILYKGYSGNYCTIVTDVPVTGKITNFEFANCTDADGNHYEIVKIGSQTWMAENIKTSHYRNGVEIPKITKKSKWAELSTGAWCNYDFNDSYESKNGHLYNWFAFNDSRNVAPAGWHVATEEDCQIMQDYLIANGGNWDGTNIENKIAKSLAGVSDWVNYDTEGTIGFDLTKNNFSGLSVLPSAWCWDDGSFQGLNYTWCCWVNAEPTIDFAKYKTLNSSYINLKSGSFFKKGGLSVRCVKD